MKKFLLLIPVLLIGCGQTTSKTDAVLVEKQQEIYSNSQPIPFFDHSLERQAAIELYEARNENVRTWTVWRSDYGLIEGHGESIGYPIPYDVQLTNPLMLGYKGHNVGVAVLEQPEPNGLWSSKNSIATWIRLVVSRNGKTYVTPVYVEGKVTTYPYPVKVDYEKNRVTPLEDAVPTVKLKK